MTTKTAKKAESYKGSSGRIRKGRVHQLFEARRGCCVDAGRKLELKDSSLRSWFGEWRRAKSLRRESQRRALRPRIKAKAPAFRGLS
jgi:hypothetical protein